MNLKFLGGAGEVGRSGVLLDTGSEKMLLDYGIKIVSPAEGVMKSPEIPLKVDLNLDGVFLTHAHLDHCGFVANLYHRGYYGPVYTTATTHDMSRILLRDSIKLAKLRNQTPYFSLKDLKTMEENENRITYGQHFYVGKTGVGVYDAGHIPGSVSFHLDTGVVKIVYSGDIKLKDTELLRGLEPIRKNTDVLIVESTYAEREHPPRDELEKKLIQIIKETVDNNGIAMVPCFAVGRSQEVLLILEKFGLKCPIYLDGMAVDATKVALKYPELLKEPNRLENVFNSIEKVYNNRQRSKIIEEPCVIVTTSGMLNGGPIAHYLEKLHGKKNCSLTMTGFQVSGSAGRNLLDTGKYVTEENNFKVGCRVEHIDLSAHIGRSELFEYIKMIGPQKVFVMHGDNCDKFAKELKEQGYEAIAPKNGEVHKI